MARVQCNYKKSSSNDHEEVQLAPWQFYFAYSVLATAISCIAYVIVTCYSSDSPVSIRDYLKIPSTVGDAKRIGSLILRYKDDHYYTVFGAYFSTYILLQSFCIPGSIVLSILAGYLFPALLALVIICICSTIGASTFYILIYNRKKTLLKFLSGRGNGKIEQFSHYVQNKVKEYRSNLFICVFLLRATPIFPNWTINLCSPLINIPLKPFVWGTFTGVAPLSVIHVWTGRILNDLSNDQSLVNWQSVLMTSLVAISIVFLVFVKRYA
uniref:Transmembrane protein 41B n=1 Tax=Aceria tosichella TaxID=561515 RepID=A0A6G1S627_9ACAR